MTLVRCLWRVSVWKLLIVTSTCAAYTYCLQDAMWQAVAFASCIVFRLALYWSCSQGGRGLAYGQCTCTVVMPLDDHVPDLYPTIVQVGTLQSWDNRYGLLDLKQSINQSIKQLVAVISAVFTMGHRRSNITGLRQQVNSRSDVTTDQCGLQSQSYIRCLWLQ